MGVWLNKDDYVRDLKRFMLFFLIMYMAILVGTDPGLTVYLEYPKLQAVEK